MDGNEERHDGEQPSRAYRLDRVKRKAGPRRRLDGAVMAFMGPFKQLPVMHHAVGPVKPRVLREEINKGADRNPAPLAKALGQACIHGRAARFPHL